MYIGHFGLDGFAKPRPIGLLIMLLGMIAGWLLLYMQEKHGFVAQPKHMIVSGVFLTIGFFIGRSWRSRVYTQEEVGRKLPVLKVKPVEKDQTIEEAPTALEAEASKLRHQQKWSEARKNYQKILSQNISPINQVKMLANIMQMHGHEGNKEEAIKTAYRALELYQLHPLGNTRIGIFMHGYILGHIKRSEGRSFLMWTPPFCLSLPIELNLSLFDQIRIRLATTACGAAIGATVGSQIPFPLIRIVWSNGAVTILSFLGTLFAFMVTNKLLEYMVLSILAKGIKTFSQALRMTVNIITVVAFMYCFLLPSILTDPYNWWEALIFPGMLGTIYCVLLINKHASAVDELVVSRYTKDN
jgi:tetratricopeptide (TPR) repeat protein